MVTRDNGSLIVFICILLLLLLVFRVVRSVGLRQTIANLQKKYAVTKQAKEQVYKFEDLQLLFRRVRNFDDWWQAVCTAAEQLGFMKLKLPLTNNDNPDHTPSWQRNSNENSRSQTLKMAIPVQGTTTEAGLSIEAEVNIGGSLESAGHRAMLFNRLLDECNVVYPGPSPARAHTIPQKGTHWPEESTKRGK